MEKLSNGSTPDEKSRLIDQLEDAERKSNDPAEKDRLAQLAACLRSAIVAGFVRRQSDTEEADKYDET